MPLLDFRQAFSIPGEPASTIIESEATLSHSEADTPPKQRQALATCLPRLYRSDRTTILFAIFAFVGGLFCAFYFFNGGELLRAAAAWSREFLYPRPSRFMAENGKIDNFKSKFDPRPADPGGDPRRQNTSPLSSDLGSLYPPAFTDSSSSGSGQATLPSGPGSLLDQLNIPPPGGDALLQSFNRAVDNLARATTLFANSTVTVVQTAVTQAPVHNAQVKSATQSASNVAARNLSAKQNGQKTSRTLNRQTQRATSTVRSLDFRQHGSGIQGLLGLGDGVHGLGSGAGAGGVGGGGGEGAVGGAMGAAGGVVGGLNGGH